MISLKDSRPPENETVNVALLNNDHVAVWVSTGKYRNGRCTIKNTFGLTLSNSFPTHYSLI